MTGVYIASKLRHREMLQEIMLKYNRFTWTPSWVKMPTWVPDEQEYAQAFWVRFKRDVQNSDYFILYGEKDDVLKGGLVEAGIAIACHVPVIIIGESESFSTWQYMPGIMRAKDFEHAVWMVECMSEGLEE